MKILGTCPDCGMPVWEDGDYEYDEESGKYWHKDCLPKSDKGIE